jgi:diadenosine tetraphosphate (Ap4A) HIT family hydrolase
VIFQDDFCIAFLDKHPRQYGHTLVAPKMHREHVLGDFTLEEYLHLQSTIYRVGRALQSTVPAERLYVICYGSQQGFSHVHWQLVPLPPGVPFEKQQGFATNPQNGIIHLSDEESLDLLLRVQKAL